MTDGYADSPAANNGIWASQTTTIGSDTQANDAVNRLRTSTLNSNTTTYSYDADGRRVSKVAPSGTTIYTYDVIGQLAAESSTVPNTAASTQYVTTDALGSTRLVTDSGGAVVAGYDDLPFGAEILASVGSRPSCYSGSDRLTQRFTGKERDAETGLDYFGARYMSSAQGRFTGPDPLMDSAEPALPQSWNRYTYGLNNPLRFVDPTGMAWQQNDAGGWGWVDSCGGTAPDSNCRSSVAVQTQQGVTVYGSNNAEDITQYAANDAGVVDVSAIAGHHDANFIIGPQRVQENYLNSESAAALFNVAGDYGTGSGHARDGKLVFTGGSAENGRPGIDPVTLQPLHQSHQGGANIDMRYMGANGRSVIGDNAASSGDINRNRAIMNLFFNERSNLGATLTGDPTRYGLAPIRPGLQRIHRNHMHFQRRYPGR